MSMKDVERRLAANPAIQEVLRSFHETSMAGARKSALADPKKYRLTTVFENPTSYRYWPAGKNEDGATVRLCWSCWKNVAGYYLSWREIENADSMRRTGFAAWETKTAAKAWSKRWADEIKR